MSTAGILHQDEKQFILFRVSGMDRESSITALRVKSTVK